jgi:hypothetical protein
MTTEQFYALPMNERAVLVAKDVIAQVEAGRYTPKIGVYLILNRGASTEQSDYLSEAIQNGLDVKENFHLIPNGCAACAIGATILSCTHLGNKLKFSDLYAGSLGVKDLDKPVIHELLASVFSPEQLLMIETAFEGYNISSYRYAKTLLRVDLEEYIIKKCNNFYKEHGGSIYFEKSVSVTDRLIAIYQNIIDNNGVFVP